MSSTARLPVFPTRMNLAIVKVRLKSAEKGHSLLKRKSDAIQIKYREVASKLLTKKKEMAESLEKAFFLLSKGELYGANLKMITHECRKAPLKVKLVNENVSGVCIPTYSLKGEERNIVFMGQSGKIMRECREEFISCLKLMVDTVSLQSSFLILDKVLEATNRRVNALECLLIPKLENTISYVNSELDEQDREEFYRLKKVQASKKK